VERNGTLLEAKAGKYLTFELGGEVYALEILKVQEIIGMMTVTHIPRMPAFIRGVINLRGKVIPVIDLRLKFEMQSAADTDRTCIIVVQVARAAGMEVTMGILVDEVSKVLNVKEDQIEPPPSFGTDVDTDFIMGMGKVGQKVLTMLDIDKVLAGEDAALIEEAAAGS
jgi:purine-binding chemotaxis protein CheW